MIYGSGLVVRESGLSTRIAVPSPYTEARVDPLTVARFVRDAEHRRLLTGDLGLPQVTDLGSDRVSTRDAGDEQEVWGYAPEAKFDDQGQRWLVRGKTRLSAGNPLPIDVDY